MHVLLMVAGIQERTQPAHGNASQPDGPIAGGGGGEEDIMTELLENGTVGVVAIMGVHQQDVGCPPVSTHEIDEAPVFEIPCLIADSGQADEEIAQRGEPFVGVPSNLKRSRRGKKPEQ